MSFFTVHTVRCVPETNIVKVESLKDSLLKILVIPIAQRKSSATVANFDRDGTFSLVGGFFMNAQRIGSYTRPGGILNDE